jgi:hypothetical protein
VKFRFTITGYATGGDEHDVKMWLSESIMNYNQMPQVVSEFEVDVEEIGN